MFQTSNIKNNCYNCKDRKIGCHSECVSYRRYKEKLEDARLKREQALKEQTEGYAYFRQKKPENA